MSNGLYPDEIDELLSELEQPKVTFFPKYSMEEIKSLLDDVGITKSLFGDYAKANASMPLIPEHSTEPLPRVCTAPLIRHPYKSRGFILNSSSI